MTLKQSIRTSALAIIGLAGVAGGAVLFGQAGQPPRPAAARAALFTDAQADKIAGAIGEAIGA